MNKNRQLEKINKRIGGCKKCPLQKTRTRAVAGEGPAASKIMFLGEAPGREEDLTGRPFCGRAGRLLDKLLEDNNIKRENVFISSILKCRPPNNRLPKPGEIKACRDWWQEQIDIIDPKKIVILGRTAFNTVIREGQLRDYRGKWLKIGNRLYFPTYHPAAALRFVKFKKILEKDFKKIKK